VTAESTATTAETSTRTSATVSQLKSAFHDADTDFLPTIHAREAHVSDVRMYRRVGRVGIGVGKGRRASISQDYRGDIKEDCRSGGRKSPVGSGVEPR